jgi:hypothetical protein
MRRVVLLMTLLARRRWWGRADRAGRMRVHVVWHDRAYWQFEAAGAGGS